MYGSQTGKKCEEEMKNKEQKQFESLLKETRKMQRGLVCINCELTLQGQTIAVFNLDIAASPRSAGSNITGE